MKPLTIYCVLSSLFHLAGCAPPESEVDVGVLRQPLIETLFAEDFEGSSHAFLVSGACSVTAAAARAGSAGIRCDDSAGLTVAISTAGATNIQVSYARRTHYYDSGELFVVEFSADGGASWQTVESIPDTTTYGDKTFSLGAQADNTELRLRFRSTASGFYEYFDLDEIIVEGDIEPVVETSELLSENFEVDLTQFSVSGACVISTSAARSGARGVRCDDVASLTVGIRTVGLQNLTMEYSRRTANYDANEYFYAEVSADGESWTVLERTRDTTYRDQGFALPADLNDREVVLIRFRSNASGFYERFDLDDVLVVGDPTSVDAIVHDVRSAANLPALAAGVMFENTQTAQAVSGVVRIDHPGEAVDIDDQFMIGSATKSMTATLVGMLVHDGVLQWDSTISEILSPDDRHVVVGTGFELVTVEQILTHTAGFIVDPSLTIDEDAPALAILQELLRAKPLSTDGSYRYSNAGYMAAGALAEYVTGIAYEELVRTRIFAPLNMHTAGFGWPDDDYMSEATDPSWYPKNPWGHWSADTIVDPRTEDWLHRAWYPAGSVKCSIGDLLKYVNWHLQGHLGNDTVLGLPQAFFEKLHAGIVDTGIDPELPQFGPGWYALGWRVHVHEDPSVGAIHAHSGDVSGFNSLMVFSPLKNIAIVTLANRDESLDDLVSTTERINRLPWGAD